MASDNEAYFAAVKRDFVGTCADSRDFNELEYSRWLDKFRGTDGARVSAEDNSDE
jgi:hypothetical protein